MTPTALAHAGNGFAPDLKALPDEDLLRELDKAFRFTLAGLVHMAAAIREADERKLKITARVLMLPYLRKIGWGQLLPAVVLQFFERSSLIQAVGNLPLPDQEMLTDPARNRIPVVCLGEGGGFTHRMLEPSEIPNEQIRQVFDRNAIRGIEAQTAYLEMVRLREARPERECVGDVVIDRDRGGYLVGRVFVPAADWDAARTIFRRGRSRRTRGGR